MGSGAIVVVAGVLILVAILYNRGPVFTAFLNGLITGSATPPSSSATPPAVVAPVPVAGPNWFGNGAPLPTYQGGGFGPGSAVVPPLTTGGGFGVVNG